MKAKDMRGISYYKNGYTVRYFKNKQRMYLGRFATYKQALENRNLKELEVLFERHPKINSEEIRNEA